MTRGCRLAFNLHVICLEQGPRHASVHHIPSGHLPAACATAASHSVGHGASWLQGIIEHVRAVFAQAASIAGELREVVRTVISTDGDLIPIVICRPLSTALHSTTHA